MNSLPSGLRGRGGMARNTAREGYLAHMHLQAAAWAHGVEQHWLPVLNSVDLFLTAYGITGTYDGSTLLQGPVTGGQQGFHFCQWNSQQLADGRGSLWSLLFQILMNVCSGDYNFWLSFWLDWDFHQFEFRFSVLLLNNLLFAAWTPAVVIFTSSGGTVFVLLLYLAPERCYLAWLILSYTLSWCMHNILKLFFELVSWMVADWNA